MILYNKRTTSNLLPLGLSHINTPANFSQHCFLPAVQMSTQQEWQITS